jgi:branched-subunit amino acid aminotransferase/4-amino-4-deoxychorismate lyase
MNSTFNFPNGEGIFETLLMRGNDIAELNRHMRRAMKSALLMEIQLPGEDEALAEIRKVTAGHTFTFSKLRLTFSKTGFAVQHAEYLPIKESARLTLASTSVEKGEKNKTYPYVQPLKIFNEAQTEGFTDAITLNSENMICETGLSTIALFIGGQWFTPPISSGILPGVMRAIAIERCGVLVRDIHISEMPEIQGALLLSSLKIAQPVSHIGDFQLPRVDASDDMASQIVAQVQYFSIG